MTYAIQQPAPRRSVGMRRKFRYTGYLLGLTIACLLADPSVAASCGRIDRTARIRINEYAVTVELAVSEQEKTCGLSLRDELPIDHGMLFIYSSDRMLRFWMKDTRMPLSIAFIASTGKILNILEMKPMDTGNIYRSTAPARYALEMPTKWFVDHRVQPGDQVTFSLLGRDE